MLLGEIQFSKKNVGMSNLSKTNTKLLEKISKSLREGDTADALFAVEDICSEHTKGILTDVVAVVMTHLNSETVYKFPCLFECCEEILDIISLKADPEDALFDFIEQIEMANDDVKFVALLKPLGKVVLRLTGKYGPSLEWSLNAIYNYVKSIPVPENCSLENPGNSTLDVDPTEARLFDLYNKVIQFYKPIVLEYSLQNERNINNKESRIILTSFLLQLLGKPLAYLNLEHNEFVNSPWFIAETLINFIGDLNGDCYHFLEYAARKPVKLEIDEIRDVFEREERTPLLSLSVFYYLLIAEVSAIKMPLVYNPLYVFQMSLHLATELLSYSEQFVLKKGLDLSHAIISILNVNEIPYVLLDLDVHTRFCKNLCNVITYCQIEKYRKLSVSTFQLYLFQFDLKGRYIIVYNVINTVKQVGIKGFLITQFKEMLVQYFKTNENISEFFSGTNFFTLLDLFCYLPHGEESDLIELSDQIISTLNLLRYLVLRDKENITKMWDHIDHLKNIFLKPLRKGLILSKAQYELKLKETEKEFGQGDSNGMNSVNITIAGQQLPDISFKEKVSVLQKATNTLEVIDCLLSRLNECIEESRITNEL